VQEPSGVLAGDLIGERYRVDSLIGSGGMASVYRAWDESLKRWVAVKVMKPVTADAAAVRREHSEVRLLASLSHPALVTLFDATIADFSGLDRTYLVMELVDGPNLGTRIEAGPIADSDLWKLTADVAEALSIVHSQGIIHRDIKPGNILLAPSPSPGYEFSAKLADFGIAYLSDATRITMAGTMMGTAAYLSPEQAKGAEPAPSLDIYSLGLVLLESLTHKREFPGSMVESVSARLARDPVIPTSLGHEWHSLLTAMTARTASDRPTASEVAAIARPDGQRPTTTDAPTVRMPEPRSEAATEQYDELAPTKVLNPPPALPVAPRPGRRSRRFWMFTAAAVVLVLVVLAIALSSIHGAPPSAPTSPLPAVSGPLGEHLGQLMKAVTP
jgi:serine/threonine protein kinase